MVVKQLFISQPFSGRTEEEVFEERAKILSKVEEIYKEKFSVIDQYHQIAPEGAGRFYYLSQDILMMDKADLIAFSPDWKSAKGCRVEHELAVAYGLNMIEVES